MHLPSFVNQMSFLARYGSKPVAALTGASPQLVRSATPSLRTRPPMATPYTPRPSPRTVLRRTRSCRHSSRTIPTSCPKRPRRCSRLTPSTSSRRSTARLTRRATIRCVSVTTPTRTRPVRTSSTRTTCSFGLRTRMVSSRTVTPASTPRSSSASTLVVTSSRRTPFRLKTRPSPRGLKT